ncbi:hypothetical protein cyc_07396 [Cyclospora cayetanensis]|uniref:Uncharacterized protein n=1 Tax=Cyclospora cayetanensis TaxID=88456 RepID=A0A1D3CSC0_9EIME|nr:hypothetical protein cyc_07396 [Cyclospora cayetanensis]
MQECTELRRRGFQKESRSELPGREEEGQGETGDHSVKEESDHSSPEAVDNGCLRAESDGEGYFQPKNEFERRLLSEPPPLEQEGLPKYSLLLVSHVALRFENESYEASSSQAHLHRAPLVSMNSPNVYGVDGSPKKRRLPPASTSLGPAV